MKKKSASRSAFFNLRVLTGLGFVLAAVFLALAGSGLLAQGFAKGQHKTVVITHSDNPLVPVPFDCANIEKFGIDKQLNMRAGAIMVACGEAEGDSRASVWKSLLGSLSDSYKKLVYPLVYGATDVNLITGAETSPHVTQSTTFAVGNPDNPLEMLVAYDDLRGANQNPTNGSGASWSTDGGNTFVRLTGSDGQSPFAGTGGNPIALYHRPSQTWFTIWADYTFCGGLGGYKTTTPGDVTSWTHFCVATGSNSIDRASGWLDNNPSSPFYGRMYVSYNDFNIGGGALYVRWSSDAGATWNPVQINATFIRNVQLTGDPTNGNVYLMTMNEGGGGCGGTRQNVLYKSTDGGVTWSNSYTGPAFVGPCRTAVGYFADMFDNPAFWRYMGWGQPAARNNIVHYVYAACGAGGCPTSNGDPGNIFYIRSTDGGATFSAPFMLNTDGAPDKAQWEPNLSVGSDDSLLAVWYDERERSSLGCQPSSPSTPCYRMWARKSTDGGVTWQPDMPFSDVVSPLPLPDPNIIPNYVSDYDYSNNVLNVHMHAWVDGRNPINGASQPDAYFDREPSVCVPNQYVITQSNCSIVPGVVDTGNHCDDCDTVVTVPFSVGLYDQIFNQVRVSSNGRLDFACINEPDGVPSSCLPAPPNICPYDYTIFPLWNDLRTDAGSGCSNFSNGCGVFTSVSGSPPNRIFNMEWHTVLFGDSSATQQFEVRLYEGQSRFDVIYGPLNGSLNPSVGGAQGPNGLYTQDFCGDPPPNSCHTYAVAPCTATIASAVSRKTHGGAGAFDVDLPLTGMPGIECRTTGGTNDYTMVVTFSGNVTVNSNPQAEVTLGTGCVGISGVCNGNVSVSGNAVTVPLTNIADAQTINVRINGVNSAADTPATDFTTPISILIGDTNGNGSVSSADVAQTKGRIGQPITASNFRSDVNASGGINSADITIIKQNLP